MIIPLGLPAAEMTLFRIGRNSMFRKVHAIGFALGIKTQQANALTASMTTRADPECRDGRDTASDRLGDQELGAAAIKEAMSAAHCYLDRAVRWRHTSLAAKESERKGAPYAAQPVYRRQRRLDRRCAGYRAVPHRQRRQSRQLLQRRMEPVGLYPINRGQVIATRPARNPFTV